MRFLQDQTTAEDDSVTSDEPASDPVPVDPSLDVLLAQMDEPDTAAPEPTGEYKNMGKPLYVVDFLNRANVGSFDTIEREVCNQGGGPSWSYVLPDRSPSLNRSPLPSG